MTSTMEIADYTVGRVGLGTMQFTGPVGMGEPADPVACIAVLRAAVDAGVGLIDTSGYYGPGVANRLVAQALAPYGDDLLLATKVGARRTPVGGFVADATPAAITHAVHENLRQLHLDTLPLVHARYMPDTAVPFEDTVGALAELKDGGLVASIGISNVTLELLDRARQVTEIASIENEFRLGNTTGRDVLDAATGLGIPYLAFRPLGNGALLTEGSPLGVLAAQIGVSPAALALAWILDQSDSVAVIPGSSSLEHMTDNLAAQEVELSDELRAALATLGLS